MIFWIYLSFSFLIFYYRLIYVDGFVPVKDITIREGEPANFSCQYRGAQMSWRYYSNEFDNIGEYISGGLYVADNFRGQFAVHYNQTEGIYGLHIEKAILSNTGHYKCAYLNTLVSVSILHVASAFVPICDIYFRDLAHSQVEFAQVNDKILLSCYSGFDSNYPKIRWLRGSNYSNIGEVNRRNTLQLPISLRQEHEDVTFTCVLGEGDIGSAPSCSEVPLPSQPVVSIVPTVADEIEGENVVFECSGRVNSGNITYDWDEATFIQFAGRYALNADKTQLRISGLKASDNSTNVTCLVTVDTGTRGSSVAILRVTEKDKDVLNGNLDGGTGGSGDGKMGDGSVSRSSTGIMAGVISVGVIAILLIIAVILMMSRRKKNKNHPAPLSPRIKSANFDEGMVRNTSQYYDDSEQYAVTGPPMVNGTTKNEQVSFFSEGHMSSGVQVTYAVAGQHKVSDNEERAMTTYDQVDRSKALQQPGEASYIPEYHVIETSNDSALPVYAEVNKGSTEHLPSENVQSLNGDGTYEMYAEVNGNDGTMIKPTNQNVTGAKINVEKPNYAKVNKKVKDDKEQLLDDGYAKPDFTVSDENICDEDENDNPLVSSPLYAEVQKSDPKGNETDIIKHEGKEKPKYAKVNKNPKNKLTSGTEA